MIGNKIAAMAHVPVTAPLLLRPLVVLVVGVMLGSALNVEILRQAAGWWPRCC